MNYRQCKAHSKRTGEQCKGRAMRGSEVCYYHGGKSLKGAANPAFKTGVHSKYLPARMVAAYENALNDPELLDLNQSIALIDTRLIDILQRVDTGESGALWRDVGKAYAELRKSYSGGNSTDILKAFAQMDVLITTAMNDYSAWAEIGRLLEDRRKQVETKQKVELQGERAVSANELMTFMSAVLHLIQSTVSDQQERNQIADGIERLIAPRNAQIQ